MKILTVLTALLLVNYGYSEASFLTASQLLDKCKSYSPGVDFNNHDESLCSGYVIAVHDTAKTYENMFAVSPLYCVPPRVTSDQVVLAVKRFLLANPELLTSPAAPQVIDALINAFPCD